MPGPTIDSITEALLLAQDGDQEATREFLVAVEPHIRRFCMWRMRHVDAVDDLTQETLLRALRGLASFQGQATGVAWTLGIARRVCLDHLRNQARHDRRVEAVSGTLRHEGVDSGSDSILAIRELVERLPDDLREAFVLVRVFGFSYADVAAILRCPLGTVQSRVSRARATLAESLSHEEITSFPQRGRAC